MLRGEAQYALDNKGRVVIPPKFRAEMGDRIVVTRWVDGCLVAFSPVEWRSAEEKLRALPLGNRENRDFVRLLLAGVDECELDRQGRITLAPHLRKHGAITRDVTIVGLGTRLEIWNTQKWRRQLETAQKSKELPEQIQALNL